MWYVLYYKISLRFVLCFCFSEVYPIFEYPWLKKGLVETRMPALSHTITTTIKTRIEMFQSK